MLPADGAGTTEWTEICTDQMVHGVIFVDLRGQQQGR